MPAPALPPAAPPPPPAPALVRAEAYAQWRLTARGGDGGGGGGAYAGLRRLRLNLAGALPPPPGRPDGRERGREPVTWFVQAFYKDGNRSGTDGRVFVQDAWVRFPLRGGGAALRVGQQKPPLGRERLTPDTALATIDRAAAVDALIPSGGLARSFARDVGVTWESGPLWVGLYGGNGAAQQNLSGNGPLFVARAAARFPLSGGGAGAGAAALHLGAAVAARRDGGMDLSRALPGVPDMEAFRGADLRLGAEFGLEAGGFDVAAEYLEARFDRAGDGGTGARRVRARGGYARVAYPAGGRVQGVARFETFDPDTSARGAHDLTAGITLGVNAARLSGRDRLQAAYVLRREAVEVAGNDEFQVQYQRYAF